MNKLLRGSFAIAHIQKSGYSLVAGHYGYSRYFIVKVTKATREGEVKEFIDWEGDTAPSKVDRFVTIYSLPDAHASVAEKAFKAQALDFVGYHDKAELKAALDGFKA